MFGLSSHRVRRCLASALLSLLLAPAAFGGTTGKIAGTVRDSERKQPLPGVSVSVEGTRMGAIADDQGRFVLLALPAGQYQLRARIVGYNDFVLTNVSVRPDFTTEVALELVSEALQLKTVEVQAERPLIQKDATGTTRFIAGDQIDNLPVRGYRDAAAQQTGVVNFQRQIDTEVQNQNTLIVRGGRPNETAYFVDGFSQQDPLTGTSSTAINNNAIQEVVVLTGGFNPEYGRIMSGAVNVITREGKSRYFGTLEALSDVLAGSWVGTNKTDYNIYGASLGGPVLPRNEDLTFFASGERRWQRDRQPTTVVESVRDAWEAEGLSPDYKPNNMSSGWTWQGKLAWQLNDNMNVKAGTLGSQDDWREYQQPYLYNLDHTPKYEDRNQSYFGSFNHVLSKDTFWNLAANLFSTKRVRGDGVAFNDLGPHYQVLGQDSTGLDILASEGGNLVTPGGYYRTSNPRYPTEAPLFWNVGHVYDDFLQRQSSYWSIQGNLTSQIHRFHQLKVGGDFQYHTLRFLNHLFPTQMGGDTPNLVDYDAYGYGLDVTYRDVVVRDLQDTDDDGVFDDTVFTNKRVLDQVRLVDVDGGRDGAKHPKIWSLYAQDKYEREGVIVNGGLRLDYIDSATPALVSDHYPLGDPATDDSIGVLEDDELASNTKYVRVSPRLGVAFPVDEKTLLRFNYGQFFQQPNLQDLYVSYRFLEHKLSTGGYYFPVGNPNLRPERTTAYEFSMARQLGEQLRLDATIYWKDVKDLVQVENVYSYPFNFTAYRNTDYATIKGIDIGFVMRPMHHISAQLNYSLSVAKGTGSVSQSRGNQAWTAEETPKQTAPLDYDQRHRLSANFDWRFTAGEGPVWGGNFRPLENAGLNVLFNVASGTPYTPSVVYNEVSLAALAPEALSTVNSRNGPWTVTLDLKAEKGFRAGGLDWSAYVWVLNLFDVDNAIQVYTSSGAPNTVGWLNTQSGQQYLADAEAAGLDGLGLYHLAENNPTNYSNPRQVRFGLRASF